MNFSQTVFIDESGTPVLNDECYAVCAIMCNDDNIDHDKGILESIIKKHGVGSELKSSAIGSKFQRRQGISGDLSALESKCVVLVIKKKHLNKKDGFSYKTSAYKYCQRRLFEKVYKSYNKVGVIVDSFGSAEFMDGFKDYIDKHFEPNIFNHERSVKYSNPKESIMLQVADFVAGTVRRYVQGDDDSKAFDLLSPILSIVEVWPRSGKDPRKDIESPELDLAIERHCTNAAMELIDEEENVVLRESLEFLLCSSADNGDSFIFGDKLLSYLISQGLVEKTKDKFWLQNSVIAPLRDKGAPIAASRDGYKIPRNQKDLKAFVDFVSQKTLPYLKKVNNMRNSLSIGLGNRYDMLQENEDLKNLMTSLSQNLDNSK